MTRRLILIRHAKSSWDQPGANDHERVLNPRGRRSCAAIGAWLAKKGLTPDEVLCSDAARTRETWSLLARHLPVPPAPTLVPDLYLADEGEMRAVLSRATGQSVAMIGHNPGIGDFAASLVKEPPAHDAFARYPTLATLILDFPIDGWIDAEQTRGTVVEFVVPREFTD